ncbi:MAG TPA: BadF/BadG/BcrA/BcrD ATPase family protein [Longimicrobiales bacterium]
MDGEIYVGIDGGGTGATAVAVDGEGNELARVRGGAALVRPTDPGAGASALADLVDRVARAAGGRLPVTGLCCALAGAGREAERRALAAALHREAVAVRLRVTSDADAAFHDAFGDAPGILLIAGTGSIALGRAADGHAARAGGWGALLGDEGSGYALGLAALRAAVRAHDGRGPATALLAAALAHAGATAADELIAWAGAAAKAEIAALAPAVFAAAREGDAVAAEIVARAAAELARHIAAVHAALAPWAEPPGIALAGGLLAPGRPLRADTIAAITRLGQPGNVLDREVDAARGAATLARISRAADGARARNAPA